MERPYPKPESQIGVLDLQGGVVEHLQHFAALGVPARRIKRPDDFEGLSGLVIPGGESTCLQRLLRRYDLDRVIVEHFAAGLKLWGTCAGAILIAREVIGGEPTLNLIDIAVARNAFGSQLDSFNLTANIPEVDSHPIPLTFIRAPKIVRLGETVRPLLEVDNFCAAARDSNVLVTVFHPELTPSLAFHRYFAHMCDIQAAHGEMIDSEWSADSWVGYAPIP